MKNFRYYHEQCRATAVCHSQPKDTGETNHSSQNGCGDGVDRDEALPSYQRNNDDEFNDGFNEVMWRTNSRFNDASHQYFYENHNQSQSNNKNDNTDFQHANFGGLRCLVYRCLFRTNKSNTSSSVILTTILLHMLTLLSAMAAKDKEMLASLMAGMFLMFSSLIGRSSGLIDDLPPFPTTVSDLSIMIIGGKNSFWNKLPCEKVYIVDEHHVAITLDDVIDHMMAHGIPLSFMQDEHGQRHRTGINGSNAADVFLEKLRKIVEENGHDPDKTAFGYLIFWSDGFLTSFVKKKDNSCWCMTVTVAPPLDNQRSIFHTHCISLGTKNGDHDVVILEKLEELEMIRKGKWRYDGRKKSWVFTSFDIIVYMGDRPEKHEVLHTLNHAGLTSKRMRYAAFTDPAVLPSCDECLCDMLHILINNSDVQDHRNRTCRTCCNWEYSDKPAWKKSAPRPNNYPETITVQTQMTIGVPQNREVGPTVLYIKPHEQTFPWLKHGVDLTLEELTNGNWQAKHGLGYLQSFAISSGDSKTIVEEGVIRNKKRKASELYNTKNVIPAIWLMGYDLKDFIDCPMHCELLLFFIKHK